MSPRHEPCRSPRRDIPRTLERHVSCRTEEVTSQPGDLPDERAVRRTGPCAGRIPYFSMRGLYDGRIRDMTVEKVSLSLDAELVVGARRVAGRRGLSALVNDALRSKLQQQRLRALLADMDAEEGPVPADEVAAAWWQWPDPDAGHGKSRPSA